ncbi:MAG: hypothetical protein KME29_36280 [Calothrix sp. FI2-JRJ7]|jgi:hypothetical protein|nr:hypothetical protein [Calothrix sp. FI2-JRJ7]
MRISVGSPLLTINHGSTFMVTDLNGQVDYNGHQGIFSKDTEFLKQVAFLAIIVCQNFTPELSANLEVFRRLI